MIDYIPSQQVKYYHKQINHRFTDKEKATLIWNSRKSWAQITDSLTELSKTTTDTDLKSRLSERIDYEHLKMKEFLCDLPGKCVYVVCDGYGSFLEVFSDADDAVEYAKNESAQYEYCTVIKKCVTYPKGSSDSFSDIRVYIDKNGEISAVEADDPIGRALAEKEAERFEFSFVDIPYPESWDTGTILKYIPSGEYCVLWTSQKDWAEVRERIKNGLKVDYIDMSLTVMFLKNGGYFSHEHINPIYFEAVESPEGSESYCAAIKALSDYWRVKNGIFERNVINACKNYFLSLPQNEHSIMSAFLTGDIDKLFI